MRSSSMTLKQLRLLRVAVPALSLALLIVGLGPAGEVPKPAPDQPVPEVFQQDARDSVAELAAIEKHVEDVVKKVTPAVVGIRIGAAAGSGVSVTKDGVVL